MNNRTIITCLLALVLMFSTGGCELISIMSSPSSHETMVEPDFDLEAANKTAQKETKEGIKVAVIVDQASHIRSQMNLRYKLTTAINGLLVNKLGLEPEQVIDYKTIAKMRNSTKGFSAMKPYQIGKQLDCDYVIVVTIEQYDLYRLPEKGLYAGTSKAVFSLYGVKQNKRLVPKDTPAKSIEIEVEVERGLEESVDRVLRAMSYCVVRDLYPISKPAYRIMDEKKDISWDWE